MKRTITTLLILTAARLVPAADKPTYIGAAVCSMCHRGQTNHMVHEKWLASKMARAFKALDPAKGEDKNPTCLACHTTGFGAGGYAVGSPNAAKFEGVQCEVCHGPGSMYKTITIMKDKKQALANGLIIPTEATCRQCHGAKNPRKDKFDFAEALKTIDHRYRPVNK